MSKTYDPGAHSRELSLPDSNCSGAADQSCPLNRHPSAFPNQPCAILNVAPCALAKLTTCDSSTQLCDPMRRTVPPAAIKTIWIIPVIDEGDKK